MSSFLETIKIKDEQIFNISYHQKRYESVLSHFGIQKPHNLIEHIKPPKKGLYRCRVVYDMQNISVSYYEYEKKTIKSLKLVYDDTIEYPFKSTNREHIQRLYGLRDKADDVLIVKNNLVSDTSIANIAFYSKEKELWLTPKTPLLKGTTRARLLDEGKLIEADISPDEIDSFSKIALLNAMIDFDLLDNCEFLL